MNIGIICYMKFWAAAMLVPAMAFGVTVESLPPCEYADTEVSTNIPLVVSADVMSRLEFSISLDASPTNCVEVSIGTDASEDGALALGETDCTFGYNCGQWFVRDAVSDREVVTEVERVGGGGQRSSHDFLLKKREIDVAWNLVKVTRRGVAEIGEVVLVEGKKPGAALIVR